MPGEKFEGKIVSLCKHPGQRPAFLRAVDLRGSPRRWLSSGLIQRLELRVQWRVPRKRDGHVDEEIWFGRHQAVAFHAVGAVGMQGGPAFESSGGKIGMAVGVLGFDRLAVAIGNKKNDGCFAHGTVRLDQQLEAIFPCCADDAPVGADRDIGADRADAGHG